MRQCTVIKRFHNPPTGQDKYPDELKCATEGDVATYSLEGDSDDFFGEDGFTIGRTILGVPAAFIASDKSINLSATGAKDAIIIGNIKSGGRGTEHRSGTWKAIVVRITDSSTGITPKTDSATMAADVFSDTLNMRSQYRACSANQLTFEPATGTGVVNGVFDASIDFTGKN